MRVAYLAEHNFSDLDAMSGTSYWIAKGLKNENATLETHYLPAPDKLLPPLEELALRAKHYWIKFYQRAHFDPIFSVRRALYVANAFHKSIASSRPDVILTALTPLSAAFLKTDAPIVYWTDATYAALLGFYPLHRFHHPDTMWDMHTVTDACLRNAKLTIFSSHWAAESAIRQHGINKNKVKVVPFGANLEISHTFTDIKSIISNRSDKTIKLLFVGKEWYRKGGDIVLAIANALHQNGRPVEVTLVGAKPDNEALPPYVTTLPFISKNTPAGLHQLKQLYLNAHFLFVPSRAEAFGIVFCEANAFGVPCIATQVGGIPEVVRDGINGATFSLEATINDYCDYILTTLSNRRRYDELALSAFNEYQTRLNWSTACQQVKQHLSELT